MKRLLLIVCLAAISLLAGVAIAGRPSSVRDDLVIVTPSSSPATPPPTTTDQATIGTASTGTTGTTDTIDTTSTTTTTVPRPSSTPAPTVSAALSTTPTTTLVPADQIRVVVANATSSGGLARAHADQLDLLGYITIATDSTLSIETTTVYFADGFQSEAIRLAEQMNVPVDAIEPRLLEAMTVDDDDGDLWLIIAPDRAP